MPTVKNSIIALALILAIHVLAIVSGWYEYNPWFDVPMHFSGGFVIAALGLALWQLAVQKITFQKSTLPVWRILTQLIIVLGFVALVGIAWEWYEFIFDSFTQTVSNTVQPAQMGLGDTMADLFLDLLGAALAFVIWRRPSDK
jgi:hypothetical protein